MTRVPDGLNRKVIRSVVCLLALFLTIGMAPASAGAILYTSGNSNTNLGGPAISGGTSTTDAFILASAASVTEVTFYAWEHDTTRVPMTSVDWSITGDAFGGTIYASGTATPVADAFVTCPLGPCDGTLRSETFSIAALSLGAGTYWLQLQNAAASGTHQFTWDVANPSPSTAYVEQGAGGMAPWSAEVFQIKGDTTTTPEPGSFGLLAAGVVGIATLRRRASR